MNKLNTVTNTMNEEVLNVFGSERSVEIMFTAKSILKYCKKGTTVLDVGGIPTNSTICSKIYEAIEDCECDYKIADFRGGDYVGDFVTYDFGEDTFDIAMFISSLEHFPQCTEGDCVYRNKEDIKGYEKALSLLNEKGKIFLTVPFGKPVWQPYHQNYNWDKLLELTNGSDIIESYTYSLDEIGNKWVITEPKDMEEILYTDKAFGVGCFVLEKN